MAKKKQDLFQPFEKITGVKKVIRCKSCGKKIEVGNFNRALCAECGYRGSRRKDLVREERGNIVESEA
ncbi:MAG: hypothetical protein ACOCQX_03670 [Candidatus Nanoarchaeia archaeon]